MLTKPFTLNFDFYSDFVHFILKMLKDINERLHVVKIINIIFRGGTSSRVLRP